MNRRNWLKTIAALVAGVVTTPLAAKTWTIKCFASKGGPARGLNLDLVSWPDDGSSMLVRDITEEFGEDIWSIPVEHICVMTKVNNPNRSKTWRG